ncbi:inositol monophosphatase [Apiospora saccharicola]
MAELDLAAIRTFLIEVAKEAGRMIVQASQSQLKTTAKANSNVFPGTDIVTETDKEVETFISQRLGEKYPSFEFLGEESHIAGQKIHEGVPTFVVDPIDGTSNLVHHLPDVCVSIGLVFGGRSIVGVVYNPFDDELWYGHRGGGAYTQKHGEPAQMLPLYAPPFEEAGAGVGRLTGACIGVDWGSDREGPEFELNLKVFTALARTQRTGGKFVNSLRCVGSAVSAICRTAAGQQDMFWECGCWAWDVAAAWCILSEAGGVIVDGGVPGNWDPAIDNRRYLAVRPAAAGQRQAIEEFWSVLGDDRSDYGPP